MNCFNQKRQQHKQKKQRRQERKRKQHPKSFRSTLLQKCFCIWVEDDDDFYDGITKDENAQREEENPPRLTPLSLKVSPYRVHTTHANNTVNVRPLGSVSTSNLAKSDSISLFASANSLSFKLHKSNSSGCYSPSSISVISLADEDCSTTASVQGGVSKPLDIEAWVSSSLEDLRVEYLDENDKCSSSFMDDVEKVSQVSSSLQSLTKKIKTQWDGFTIPNIYKLIKSTLNQRSSKVIDSSTLDLSKFNKPSPEPLHTDSGFESTSSISITV